MNPPLNITLLPRFAMTACVLLCVASAHAHADLPRTPSGDPSSNFEYIERIEAPFESQFVILSSDPPPGYDLERLLESIRRTDDAPSDQGEGDGTEAVAPVAIGFATYGAENSRAVAMAVVEVDGRQRLLVDSQRRGAFELQSAVEPADADRHLWETSLDAEFVLAADQFEHDRRRVQVRLHPALNRLQLATVGYLKGTVTIGDRQLAAVRVDRNSNGRWFDPEDRFWIDVDGDGHWNVFREQFACQTSVMLGDQRFVIEADERGRLFSVSPLLGTGTLTLEIPLTPGAELIDLEATLVSRDGVHVFYSHDRMVQEVPVGEYHAQRLRLRAVADGQKWLMEFTNSGRRGMTAGVTSDQASGFNPLIGLRLHGSQTIQRRDDHATIIIHPHVSTSTGLYLTLSRMGESSPSRDNSARTLSFYGDQAIDMGSSGFL